MLHLIHGPDEFRASEALASLKRALDGDGALATNTTELAGRGLQPAELIQHASALPFLGSARLVIVEGLFGALGGRRNSLDAWRSFVDFAAIMPETSHVVFREPPPRGGDRRAADPSRHPLARALQETGRLEVQHFAELRPWGRGGQPSELALWLRERARDRGIAVEPAALDALVDLVGASLRVLDGELTKLATFAGGRAITAADVAALTPQAREESIFEVVDAIVEGRGAVAIRLVRQMFEVESHNAGFLQAMIARQYRHLVRAGELLEQRAGEEAIAEATGVRRGFALTKLLRQARATRRADAERGLHAIEESDRLVKTGRLDEELALELLVMRLAAGPRAAAGSRR